MKRLLWYFLFLLFFYPSGILAQTPVPVQTLYNVIANAPTETFALSSSDKLLIAQGGTLRSVPAVPFALANTANFVTPTGTFAFGTSPTTLTAAHYIDIQGSVSSPDTSANATMIVQRIGTGTAIPVLPAAFFGILATGTTPTSHGTAVYGFAEDGQAYTGYGSFIEGVRGECHLTVTSVFGQCSAFSGEVNYETTQFKVVTAIESAINNNTGVAPTLAFSPLYFSAAFLASCGDHGAVSGGSKCENAFVVNPNNAYGYLRGIYIPPNAGGPSVGMDSSGFGIDIEAAIDIGIRTHKAVYATAGLTLPNESQGGDIFFQNGAQNAIYRSLGLNTFNQLVVGTDANIGIVFIGNSTGITQAQNHLIALGTLQLGSGTAAYSPGSIVGACNAQTIPTTLATGYVICDNYSSGGSEVNFWNTQVNPSPAFDWRQKTGTSTFTVLASLGSTAFVVNVPITDAILPEFQVASATLTATSNTTLATVTGLSQALTAGKTYNCSGHLTGVANASGGLKVALVATGGLTATQASFTGFLWNGTAPVANTTVTALGSNIAANTAAYTDLYIDGSIVVNVAGTINVQAAQNASFGTSTTVLLGSTFACVRIN